MITSEILNPHLLSLLARIRHTNTVVIADRGFPNWPHLETVDISLTDNIPRVLDVLAALRNNFIIGRFFMAEEFLAHNPVETREAFQQAMQPTECIFEPHIAFKQRVPGAIGLIRTADTTQYGNVIIESA
jgi:D-ribose pyranase